MRSLALAAITTTLLAVCVAVGTAKRTSDVKARCIANAKTKFGQNQAIY